MKTQIILLLSLIISLSSCKSYYLASDFDTRTTGHKTIAVLPFEIQTEASLPPELSEADIEQIQESESKAFQVSFHNQILRSTQRGNRALRIKLQHYSKTINTLEENNISIIDSWEESPETLAQILGVDAVVKGRIQKEKYFSDELSVGIEIGSILLDRIGTRGLPISNNNKSVRADFSILDSEEGSILWSINYNCQADWRQQADQIVDNINRRSARHFPYRLR